MVDKRHSGPRSVTLKAGVTVARRLGHSSPAITLGYYAHFRPEAASKGADGR
ncbi:UNVERIFIED_CONTAM: integrase [Streptomyces canus]